MLHNNLADGSLLPLQVLTCNQLDTLSGKQLFFKAEMFQVRHIQQQWSRAEE
jgi:hypothetical protein